MILEECDEILRNGYPSVDELTRFPLGEKIKDLDMLAWTKTSRVIKLKSDEPDITKGELEKILKTENRMLEQEELGEIYRQHIKRVMEAIISLTTNRFTEIAPDLPISEWANPPYNYYVNGFLNEIDDDMEMFIRFLAFYHDIGKVIHRDRHPILGRHLLESLDDNETKELKTILRFKDKDLFFIMAQLIGHHDLFGVLCTGEASRLVLIDALRPKEAKLVIGCLATLNLADIYGTFSQVTPRILKTVLNDWHFMVKLLSQQEAEKGIVYRSDIEKKVLMESQAQENAVERIKRLVTTSILMLEEEQIPLDESKKLAERVTSDVVLDALMNRLGPELLVFCYDFALVCKFDYTLKFLVKLVSRWLVNRMAGTQLFQDIDVKGIAAIFVEVLVRLIRNYRDLTRQREGWPRRIGIELLGLTRSRDISEKVIDLLLGDRHVEGVNWIADEATAWYFI